MVFHFDPLNPLLNVDLLLNKQQLDMMNEWFDRVSKPFLIVDEGPPQNVITVENLVGFTKRDRKRFHRRNFEFPTYAQIMKGVEEVNAHEIRLLTRDQFIYVVNKWIRPPILKHELLLAFKIFDSENREYLESEILQNIVIEYSNKPFHEKELVELLRDANLRGDGNVYYKEFIESMFAVAPELHKIPVEHIYEDPDEDPSVEPEPEEEAVLPILPPPPPLPSPLPPPKEKKKSKKKK